MQFRLITVAVAAILLSGCGDHDPTLTKVQRNELCHAFWEVEDANSSEIQAQIGLLNAIDEPTSKGLIEIDTAAARKGVDRAREMNDNSRAQLDVVCGPAKP